MLLDVEGYIGSLAGCEELGRITVLQLILVEGGDFDLDGFLPLLLPKGVYILLELNLDGFGVRIRSCV